MRKSLFATVCLICMSATMNWVQAAQSCTTTTIPVSGVDINGISGTSDTNIIAVGDNTGGDGQIAIFDGTNWVAQTDPSIPNEDLNDVFVFSTTSSVVVGDDGTILIQSGTNPATAWSTLASPTGQDITTVWAYSTNEIYIAGDNGTLYLWNGSSWSNLATAAGANNNDDFIDSWGDANNIYFLTDEGNIFIYDRSSGTPTSSSAWNEVQTCAVGNLDINGFTTDGAGNFYLVGQLTISQPGPDPDVAVIYKWDGTTCSLVYQNPADNTELNAISISSSGGFTAVGDDGLVVTSTDGTTWSATTSGTTDLNAVWTSPSDTAYYAVNNGSIQTCIDIPTHFSISHDGAAVACVIENITIARHDTNHNIDTSYTGTINLTTSTAHGDWSIVTGNGTLVNNGNGSASYTYVASDNGQVVLGFADGWGETVNFNVTDGTFSEFTTEDSNLIVAATSVDTFLDSFNTPGFTNNDGTLTWAGDWIEFDPAGSGSNSGNVSTAGGRLRLDDRPDTGADPSAARQADLSAYTSAVFSFDYFTSGGVDASDAAVVEISNDGGGSWVILETFTGISGVSSGSRNFNLENYFTLTATTQVRFRISNLYGGANETFEVDNVQIAVSTPQICLNTLDHFEISHDGAGLTCNAENIIVKACADATCSSLYNADVSVTFTPTGWQPTDTQTITASTAATIQLRHNSLSPVGATSETITLGVTSSTPTASNPVVCKDLSGNVSSCDMVFYDSGFVIDVPTQTSCLLPGIDDVTIRAVRKDLTSQQCVPAFTSRAATLQFSSDFTSPTTDPGKRLNLVYNGNTYTIQDTGDSPSVTDVPINFDVNGEATMKLQYNDAGQLTLNASFTGTGAEAGLVMLGNQTFVVKPHSYYLQAYYDNAGAEVNLNNSGTTGTPSWKASDNFRFRLRGQCQNGTITTNYQPTDVEMLVELTQPAAGGTQSNLTLQGTNYASSYAGSPTWHNISTHFSGGQVTDGINNYANAAFHEVGVLNLHIRDQNYFGASIPEQTLTVGRFTPHHFDTVVTHGCTGGSTFTYAGQPFSVEVIAKNNLTPTSAKTNNYAGTLAKDVTLSTTSAVAGSFNGTNAIASTDFIAGSYTKTNVAYTFSAKDSGPDAAFVLRATDTDNISSNDPAASEATTDMRSGRSYVENAFGSELVDLQVPTRVQYFDGIEYIANTNDTCTAITAVLSDIGTDPVSLGSGAGQTCIWDDDGESGANNCAAVGPVTSQFEEPPVNGSFNLFLKAPGQDSVGDIGVSLTSPTWLQYDWDGDGNHDNDPSGVASFGLYRGDDRIIYWREVFQ